MSKEANRIYECFRAMRTARRELLKAMRDSECSLKTSSAKRKAPIGIGHDPERYREALYDLVTDIHKLRPLVEHNFLTWEEVRGILWHIAKVDPGPVPRWDEWESAAEAPRRAAVLRKPKASAGASPISKKLKEGRYPRPVERAVADIGVSLYLVDGSVREAARSGTSKKLKRWHRKDYAETRNRLGAEVIKLADMASAGHAPHRATTFDVLCARLVPGNLTCSQTTPAQAFEAIIKMLMIRSGWGPEEHPAITGLVGTENAASGTVFVPLSNGAIGFKMAIERGEKRPWQWRISFADESAAKFPSLSSTLDIEDDATASNILKLFAECLKSNQAPCTEA